MSITIGIQGDRGSTNERACHHFAHKHHWDNYEIQYLISSERVLQALQNEEVDYGTFAWSTSRFGLVDETQRAIVKYPFTKVDEVTLQLDHVLLSKDDVDLAQPIRIYSHQQALEEHRPYLDEEFPDAELIGEIDTAVAAQNLCEGKYPANSLVVAPVSCAEIYDLTVFRDKLYTNKKYRADIYLIKK